MQQTFAVYLVYCQSLGEKRKRKKKILTERGDEVAPEFGGLPREEEESEESNDYGVGGLVDELGVDASGLGEVGGLGRPHGGGAEAQEHAGRHQGVEPGVELETDVGGVAEHAQAEGPLDGEPLDDEGGHEYAAEDEGRVYGRQTDRAEAVVGVYGTLEVGRALERGELDHEGDRDGADVLEDPPLLAPGELELAGLSVVLGQGGGLVGLGRHVVGHRAAHVVLAEALVVVALQLDARGRQTVVVGARGCWRWWTSPAAAASIARTDAVVVRRRVAVGAVAVVRHHFTSADYLKAQKKVVCGYVSINIFFDQFLFYFFQWGR